MIEVNLLKSLPQVKRNLVARSSAKSDLHIETSRLFGEMYFDGPREFGYGGYRYDGRWKPVAEDIIQYFNLKPGDRVLDVGCAKGFLVKELLLLGVDAYGIDVSHYAINNCESDVIGRLHLGSADNLPFPNNSFSAVLSINTIHNLDKPRCITALKEKEIFENWVLTAKFYGFPSEWIQVFKEAGYTGSYYWTVVT